jgi:hypothetical protein
MITNMSSKYKMKHANQDEIKLYCLVGEALCMVQPIEDALSHSITLKKDVKKPYSMPLKKANELLEGYRFKTLGQAIKLAKKEGIYPESLVQNLEFFLSERNWLVHKCMHQNRDDMNSETSKQKLLYKIKNITEKAQTLLQCIEEELIDFSSLNGLDMSGVLAVMQKHYE